MIGILTRNAAKDSPTGRPLSVATFELSGRPNTGDSAPR